MATSAVPQQQSWAVPRKEDCLAHKAKNIHYLILYRKKLQTSSLDAYLGLSALSFYNSKHLPFQILDQVNQQMMGLIYLDHALNYRAS